MHQNNRKNRGALRESIPETRLAVDQFSKLDEGFMGV